jgi:N-terminal domain of galactosyltransferase
MIELSLVVAGYRDDTLRRKLENLRDLALNGELAGVEVCVVILESERERLTLLSESWPFELRILEIPDAVMTGKYAISYKRNWGAKHAMGTVLLFTDDDVLHVPGGFQALLKPYRAGLRGIVSGDLKFEDGTVFQVSRTQRIHWMHLNGSLLAIDRPSFEALGGFKDDIRGRGGEDIELGYRASRSGVPMRRLETLTATHIGEPRTDAATAKACGYQAFHTARTHGAAYGLALGVHPAVLAVKQAFFALGLGGLIAPKRFVAYERGYLEGALSAKRELEGQAPASKERVS